jgi:thiamine-monophosphate kinase
VSEFERIATLFAPLAAHAPEAANLLDDTAFIKPNTGETWVVTTDAISEGVHYLPNTPPALIARKLLRTNLSDLAAKGATPRFYTLNIMLSNTLDDLWLAGFVEGLRIDQERFGITLIGGDSIAVKGAHASFSITALGIVTEPQIPLKRSGAKTGDILCVSGSIGEAAVGLHLASGHTLTTLNQEQSTYYQNRYELPEPRLVLGQALLGIATSCMDISDGLIQDADHIAKASGKELNIQLEKIPIATDIDLRKAVTHGDDYELLFTIPADNWEEAQARTALIGIKITQIGKVAEGQGVMVRDGSNNIVSFPHKGWKH